MGANARNSIKKFIEDIDRWKTKINKINQLTNDAVEISLSIVRNKIQDDGFDGWDYGSGSDQYLYKSVGLRLYLEE